MSLNLRAETGGATEPGRRKRELETGDLVERAVRARLSAAPEAAFLVERARADVAALAPSSARKALWRAVEAVGDGCDRSEVARALVCYGGVLERHRERREAVDAFEAALSAEPDDPELMLHAARAHRKAGNREAARALYGRVRERGSGRLARFSALGEALLSESPEARLGAVRARAEEAGDGEVAAVALEERGRLRREAGRWSEAVEDLTRSALSYEDRRDRLRVAHTLADVLLAVGDLEASREALVVALELSFPGEADHAVQRLRSIARAQGDEVALRRWPPAGNPSLVSLMPRRGSGGEPSRFAPVLREWRDGVIAS